MDLEAEVKEEYDKKKITNDSKENKNLSNKKEKEIKNKKKEYLQIPDNKVEISNENTILFDGQIYKKYARYNKYKSKKNIKRIIYKCINNRKNENFSKEIHNKGTFCNATIIYIYPHQNINSGYFVKHEHSQKCIQLNHNSDNEEKKDISKDKDNFITKCEEIMNSSTIFDRNLFKTKFKEIYNSYRYNFPISNNLLSNMITKWRNNSMRFNKANVLINQYDYRNRLIFREFRSINVETTSKKKPKLLEYIIWGNDENISRLRLSKNYFIDGTFHHPPEFKQLLIIMYRDIISSQNIPGIYILINGKYEEFYDIVFDSLIKIITQNHKYDLNVETIVTDTELALINVIKKYFPNSKRIGCFFHYKNDILRKIKSYGLYKKKIR